MKTQAKTAVEYWLSACNQHRHETAGFSVVLHNLTPDDLMGMKQVTDWFLDFAPHMFRVLTPKEHPGLRSRIAYLTELKRLQDGVAEGYTTAQMRAISETLKETAQWVAQHNTSK